MARKKNLKDLDPEAIELVESKMMGGLEERYQNDNQTYNVCSKALEYKVALKCKNEKQKEYHKLIKDKEVVLCSGEPGTGKSYIALATILELLKADNPYRKLMIVVPTVEAGNMNIGYLKGTKDEKIEAYLQADLYTMEKILNSAGNNGKECLKTLQKCGIIEAEPVGFMRGKTLDNTIVLITEAENFNKQELFLILSRIGNKSKYIINGDVKQLDRKDIRNSKQECGLEYAMRVLEPLDEVGIIRFGKEDIVRNPLIGKIMDKWFDLEDDSNKNQPKSPISFQIGIA